MNPRRTSEQASATLFAALGDETRLRMVVRMAGSETLTITDLAAGTGITRQAVTKHLHVLAGAGVARCSRRGREQHWTLDGRRLQQARAFLDHVAAEWGSALARLKSFVEEAGD